MSKFSSPLAERLYLQSLEGFQDADLGDSQTFGWFALFEREHAILNEDGNGFVTVTVFETLRDVMDEWNEIRREWIEYDEDFYVVDVIEYDEYADDYRYDSDLMDEW